MITPRQKQVLFIACTHGNEPIGKLAVEGLLKNKNLSRKFDCVIGNPRAYARNIRFTDSDLNRSAPGRQYSKKYEVRRAFQLIQLFKRYRYVIDLHQTRANNRIVVIIPKLTRRSLALALAFDVRDVLIWPSSSSLKSRLRPLTEYKDYGIEIESGIKANPRKTLMKLTVIVYDFLMKDSGAISTNLEDLKEKICKRKFYLVYDRIGIEDIQGATVEDFKEVDTGEKKYIALLFGRRQGLIGYKMRRVSEKWISNSIS